MRPGTCQVEPPAMARRKDEAHSAAGGQGRVDGLGNRGQTPISNGRNRSQSPFFPDMLLANNKSARSMAPTSFWRLLILAIEDGTVLVLVLLAGFRIGGRCRSLGGWCRGGRCCGEAFSHPIEVSQGVKVQVHPFQVAGLRQAGQRLA